MTPTAAHPSLLERAQEWLRHKTKDLGHDKLIVDLVEYAHGLEHRLAALEALVVKDAPAVANVVKETATVIADVQKAAGAS